MREHPMLDVKVEGDSLLRTRHNGCCVEDWKEGSLTLSYRISSSQHCSFLYFSPAADKISPEGGRLRRNSDSFLFLSQKKDKVTLMQPHPAENKWNFKMQILENEIDKLQTEIALTEENGTFNLTFLNLFL